MELVKFEMELLKPNEEVIYKVELLNAEEELKNSELYKKVVAAKKKYEDFIKSKSEFEQHIKNTMLDNKVDELNIGDYRIKLKKGRKSQSVEVIDDKIVPDEYLRHKVEVDKSKALKELKEGVYIEGLFLNEKIGEPTLEVSKIEVTKELKTIE